MAVQCANCQGYFSYDEITRRKPPLHVWKLTQAGLQALHANAAVPGEHPQCPACGQRTLISR